MSPSAMPSATPRTSTDPSNSLHALAQTELFDFDTHLLSGSVSVALVWASRAPRMREMRETGAGFIRHLAVSCLAVLRLCHHDIIDPKHTAVVTVVTVLRKPGEGIHSASDIAQFCLDQDMQVTEAAWARKWR